MEVDRIGRNYFGSSQDLSILLLVSWIGPDSSGSRWDWFEFLQEQAGSVRIPFGSGLNRSEFFQEQAGLDRIHSGGDRVVQNSLV